MRYIKLYLSFVRFGFSKAMEFRLDFFFRFFMDIFYYVFNLAFFNILFLHTATIGGWNQDQVFVFVASFIFVDALYMTIVANNMWWLPIFINRGDLDYHFTRPIPALFFLSLRDFSANSFFNLLVASGILTYSLIIYPQDFTAFEVLSFLGWIIHGTYIMYLIRIMLTIPSFWLQSDRGLTPILDSLIVFQERPHQIFSGRLKTILTTVLPFALVASVPSSFLFSPEERWSLGWSMISVSVCLSVAVVVFWNFASRDYASASS